MKTLRLILALSALLTPALRADIEIRLSVKFILSEAGDYPSGTALDVDINTPTAFAAELARDNANLARIGRGYSMRVVSYSYIIPPPPAGQPGDYWFNINARAERATIDAAARADQAHWDWTANAINIYVNNSRSGQCSDAASATSISLGARIGSGTIVHEIGHFHGLAHTHPGDIDSMLNNWGDGDGLAETLPDEADASAANVQAYHATRPAAQINALLNNIMSYHTLRDLLPVQMDLFATTSNGVRPQYVNGKTIFVATNGSDSSGGDRSTAQLRTLTMAVSKTDALRRADVVLLRAGSYGDRGWFNQPCTWRTAAGVVRIGQ